MISEAAQPSIGELRSYLRFKGWIEQPPGPSGSLWIRDDVRIGMPTAEDSDLISGVVRRLAAAERRTPKDVVAAAKYLLFDVTHLRAANDSRVVDAIPLETGVRILASARAMLRATATTARRERAHIATNYSKLGDDVVRQALMGHTQKGSYVIPVLVPIPEPSEPDLHQPTLHHTDEELHRAPSEPFERRVVRTFAQSMQAVREIVVNPARTPTTNQVYELVYRGVSREFCTALARILDQRAIGEFQATVDWAPAVPAPETMPRSVTIEAEAADLVKLVAEKLSQQKVHPSRVFSGTIVQLRHESQDDPFGEIAIATVRQGHAAEILVRLRMEQYLEAWNWHYQGRAVLVEGTVRRAPGKPLRVDMPTRCHPVDEMMLPQPPLPRPQPPLPHPTPLRQIER
jgi:hypothetical protein